MTIEELTARVEVLEAQVQTLSAQSAAFWQVLSPSDAVAIVGATVALLIAAWTAYVARDALT